MSDHHRAAFSALLACLLGLLATPTKARAADQINWLSDYEQAVKLAEETGRPILLEFTSKSCGWCRKLEDETHTDTKVISALSSEFIPVRLFGRGDLRSKYGGRGTPYTAIIDNDGQQLATIRGFRSPSRYFNTLKHAAGRQKLYDQSPEALALLLEVEGLMKDAKWEPALEALGKAVELAPQAAELLSRRAKVHYHLDDLDQATADATNALRLDPHDPNAHYTRGMAYFDQGKLALAMKEFKEQGQKHPRWADSAACRIWMVMALSGKLKPAVSMIDAYRENYMANEREYDRRFEAIYLAGHLAGTYTEEGLMSAINRSYKHPAFRAHGWYTIGMKRLAEGNRAGAIEALQKMTEQNYKADLEMTSGRRMLERLQG